MGSRMKLKYTRAIIDAIHSGELSQAETAETAIFKLQVCVWASMLQLVGLPA